MKKKASPSVTDENNIKRKKRLTESEDKMYNFENNLEKRLSFKEELDREYEKEKKEKFKNIDVDIINGYKLAVEPTITSHLEENLSENFLHDHSVIKQLD